jgi:hypothetical protein
MRFKGMVHHHVTRLHGDSTAISRLDVSASKHQGCVAFRVAVPGHSVTGRMPADPGLGHSLLPVGGSSFFITDV